MLIGPRFSFFGAENQHLGNVRPHPNTHRCWRTGIGVLGGDLTVRAGGLCIARTAARELVSFGAAAPKVAAYRAPLLENWSRATDIKKWPTPKGWPNGGHKKMASPEGLARCHHVSGSDRTANSATITTTLNANRLRISRSIFASP